jgi:hypothetical protein
VEPEFYATQGEVHVVPQVLAALHFFATFAKNNSAIKQKMFSAMERIPTKNGVVRCSREHGENERVENIAIATHFAEKYGHEIDLLPRSHKIRTADAYNITLGVHQEFKTNNVPTYTAIDTALRKASKQANHIVLHILSDISDDFLKAGIKGRVMRQAAIEVVTTLRNGEDKTYTRAQILSKNFAL